MNSPHIPHRAALAALAAGVVGPLLDHWLTRALVSALIALACLLLGELLRPWVARRGRLLVGLPVTLPPPPPVPGKDPSS